MGELEDFAVVTSVISKVFALLGTLAYRRGFFSSLVKFVTMEMHN